MKELIYIEEPNIKFAYNQMSVDPRDGLMPVTLRFANNIGEILTSCLDIKSPPLAFKYYI